MNQYTDHTISKYISGELSAAEARAFEAQMKQDSGLEQEVNTVKAYLNRSSTQFDTDTAWEKMNKRINKTEPETKIRQWKKPLTMALAASIIVFAAAISLIVVLQSQSFQKNYVAETRMEISLPDQSTVTLKKGSQMILDTRFNEKTRSLKLIGEAYFQVTPDKNKPFTIKGKHSNITVTGTSFLVRTTDCDQLFVVEGSVNITHKTEATQENIYANESATATESTLFKQKSISPNALAWALHRFNFNNTTLEQACALIADSYERKILFADSAIGKRLISATFSNQTFSEVIEIIAETHNLEYNNKNGTVLLSTKP
ncbi:MAG: FecR domain-containing protein [Salinivirgaceae bacterium]|jgi:transmembrane sensor|nr:FecR domain-containing protein [Salinivirgaceae bacterium]